LGLTRSGQGYGMPETSPLDSGLNEDRSPQTFSKLHEQIHCHKLGILLHFG
jgi:hypothetical protein